jgi:hypothetical protein
MIALGLRSLGGEWGGMFPRTHEVLETILSSIPRVRYGISFASVLYDSTKASMLLLPRLELR